MSFLVKKCGKCVWFRCGILLLLKNRVIQAMVSLLVRWVLCWVDDGHSVCPVFALLQIRPYLLTETPTTACLQTSLHSIAAWNVDWLPAMLEQSSKYWFYRLSVFDWKPKLISLVVIYLCNPGYNTQFPSVTVNPRVNLHNSQRARWHHHHQCCLLSCQECPLPQYELSLSSWLSWAIPNESSRSE